MNNILKQRLTAFIDPMLMKRAKVRGALEGLTLSEIVEKALDAYAPKLEKDSNQHIHIKFDNSSTIDTFTHEADLKLKRIAPKHTKSLTVPR